MISFENVSKEYDNGSVGIKGINLKIKPQEFVSIIGHSGAGKSTLLKMILAEEHPTGGVVLFDEVDLHRLPKRHLHKHRRRIGTIFQDFRLLTHKTAYENIAFAMEVAGKNEAEIRNDVPYVLELVGLLDKMYCFPYQLSGGERQRIAIARAIVNQPDLIIADEPTGNLDPINTYDVIQLLKKINELGTTVILTTHNKGIIDSVGGRVITIEDGKIVRDSNSGEYVL